ncbi:AraC family transcriptional regulator [Prosthecobacter fluviatilis]|uniref:Helix-turn-helix domain-containing protein n=1 Tax=Prosthecobacter fluviatilis TaxID=445931 RepID=A0ABW0KSM0_9BACT
MPLPRLQADFFARIADPQGVRAIFEHMPGVFFFMKDDRGRHIAANSATFQRFGIRSERELVGAMDEKFFPPEVAKAYREDDQKVIRSGRPLINRLEVWYDEQRNLNWFLCTKLPVKDRRGKVIGVMGITRRDEDRMRHHDVREVAAAMHFADEHCQEAVTTGDLARAVGVSERHLHRKLRAALGLSPYELLLRTRIQSAAEALAKSSTPIIQIALDHGFCDQSAFTQQFRKRTGMTPREFRRRHQG